MLSHTLSVDVVGEALLEQEAMCDSEDCGLQGGGDFVGAYRDLLYRLCLTLHQQILVKQTTRQGSSTLPSTVWQQI